MSGPTVALHPLTQLPAGTRRAWELLAQTSSQDNPFTEAAFALAAAGNLELGATAQLLAVEQDGEMLLALPVRRIHRLGHVPLLALSGWQHEYAFLGAPLVVEGRERDAWTCLLDGLRRRRVPTLVLPLMPTDGPSSAALTAAADARGASTYRADVAERAALQLPVPPDYLAGRLSGTSRKNLRRLARKLAQQREGGLRVLDLSGCPEGIETFLRIEAAGWKGRTGTAMAVRPGHRLLLDSVLSAWGDRVQVLLLELGGSPIAAQVSLLAGRTRFEFKIAYDEDHADYSPGLQLELLALERLRADDRVGLIDSCAKPGHEMAERLLRDRRELATVLVPLTATGRVQVAGFRWWRGRSTRTS